VVTTLIALLVVAAVYAGLTWRLQSTPAFLAGVAITLGLWAAPFVLPSSYANVLYLLLGVIGSIFFGLLGVARWWRSRKSDGGQAWLWLAGGVLAAGPAIVLVIYQLSRR
jgi:hypothetical protein